VTTAKASTNEPSDHSGKASAKKRASTLSVAKHLRERGPKSQRRQSIRQGLTDGQASIREEVTPYGKASVAGGGHNTLSSKASTKEEASDNGGKASARETNDGHSGKASAKNPPKEEVIAAKHPLERCRRGQEQQDKPLQLNT
jgi:hypothetical protein